jgi:hypothetical protein
VEGIGRITAVGSRIGQRPGDLGEFHDRTRPAVRDDQRDRIRFRGPDMSEMDVRPIDRGGELRPLVEPGLGGPPGVLV